MIPRQPFGNTGHISSRVLFGAAALGAMSQERADQTMEVVLEYGLNHIDTAASYGESELRLRPFLDDHRDQFFLATKTGERQGDAARRELERSLQRMNVDHVDLVQLHNLVEPDEFEIAHGPGGVVEALVRSRDEGLVRVCAERNVAVQTIKSVARRRWPEDSDQPHYAWYEPLPAGDALQRGVAFVLGRDGLFLNSSSDVRLLRPILEAASNDLQVPSAEQLDADVAQLDMSVLFDGAELERI
ncbi:MAG: putative aldo-keto reductase [Ilumatobacteraceae bacterium]|nr:putative aldo-keto reductase [Ilumatobacteraceae bacterium]